MSLFRKAIAGLRRWTKAEEQQAIEDRKTFIEVEIEDDVSGILEHRQFTFRGKLVDDLSRDEAIDAVKHLVRSHYYVQQSLSDYKQMKTAFAEAQERASW